MPRLSASDVAALAIAGIAVLVLFSAPPAIVPRFAEMYRDFGDSEVVASSLSVAGWLMPLLCAPILVLAAMGLRSDDLVRRRVLLASAAAIGVLAVIGLFAALYYPLYAVTEAIAA